MSKFTLLLNQLISLLRFPTELFPMVMVFPDSE